MLKAQIVEPRICYFPFLGMIIAGTIMLDQLAVWSTRYPPTRILFKGVVGAATLVLSLPCVLSLVGVQYALRQRYLLDQSEMAQLKALVPEPPAETVFVPLSLENTPTRTGFENFDRFAVGALGSPWSAKAIIRQTYKRRDLHATARSWWLPLPLHDFDASSAEYPINIGPRKASHPADGTRIPWSRMIPFVVDAESKVHLVSAVRIERANHDDLQIALPYLQALLRRQNLPERVFVLKDDADAGSFEPLSGWRWATTGEPVPFNTVYGWQSFHLCTAMHPVYAGEPNLGTMRTILPPSEETLQLHFRAAFAEHDPNQGKGDGVEVIWYLDGERDASLARLYLPPGRLVENQRWFPVTMTVPPHHRERILYVEVLPGPAGDVTYDMTRVTIGYRQRKQ